MERKFTSSGQEVEVVQALADGSFLVCSVYEQEDGEWVDAKPWIVNAVFDTPPVEKFHKSVTEIQAKIDELTATRRQIQAEVAELQKKDAERKRQYQQHKCLDRLDDFLSGKITHYAVIEYRPEIVELKNAVSSYDEGERPRPLKLLSLFGDTKGDISWKLNHYRDGSGGWTTVIPATSYEEAEAAVRAHIKTRLEETAKNPRSEVVESADKFGVAVPPEYAAAVVASQVASLEKTISDQRATLAKNEQALKALQPEARDA